MMSHVDEGLLHAYLDGAFDADAVERSDIETHLALCADCRVRLEDARRLRDDAQDVLAQLVPPASPAPAWSEIVEAHAQRSGSSPAGSVGPRRRRPFVPMAWAASLILALGAGWMARTMFMGRPDLMPAGSVLQEAASIRATEPRDEKAAADALAEPPLAAPAVTAEAERRRVADAAASSTAESPQTGRRSPAPPPQGATAAASAADERESLLRAGPERDGAVVTGRVTDEEGQPLRGAQVAVSGTALGGVTDSAGRFRIEGVPAGQQTLKAELIGFAAQERRLALGGDSAHVMLQLGAARLALEEIIVTGNADSGRAATRAASPPTVNSLRAEAAANRISNLEAAVSDWSIVTPAAAAEALGMVPASLRDAEAVSLRLGHAGATPIVSSLHEVGGGAVELVQVREGEPGAQDLVPAGALEALRVVRGLRVLLRTHDAAALAQAVLRLH
jgi:hypothetical protein